MAENRLEWLPVAVWETLRTVRRKDFLFSVLLTPALIVGVGLVVPWFKQRESRQVTRIAVVSPAVPGAAAAAQLPPLQGFEWVMPPDGERSLAALKRAVAAKRVEGAVVLSAGWAEHGRVRLVVRRTDPAWRSALLRHLREQARLRRAAGLGLDPGALGRIDAPLVPEEVPAVRAGRVSRADRIAAIGMMMLTIMSVLTTGGYMGISIAGEKQARVTEVIVSAIRPQSWMDGKIVAFSLIGLTQVALWVASFGVIALLLGWPLPAGARAGVLAASALLFFLGLLVFVALYALIYATLKDIQSTSKLQAYLILLPLVPIFFLGGVLKSPDAPWVVVVSQVPFFAPVLLPMRLALGAVSGWEIALAAVLLAATAWLLRGAAGAAFRIAMLMYGKEVSLPELWRCAREG